MLWSCFCSEAVEKAFSGFLPRMGDIPQKDSFELAIAMLQEDGSEIKGD